MSTMNHEFPTRSLEGDHVTHLLAVTTVLALHIPIDLWHKARKYAQRPPKDAKRDKVVKLYGQWIAHIYNALIIDGLAKATIFRYTVIFGKFMLWLDDQGYKAITRCAVEAFIAFRVTESRENSKKRFGKSNDPQGLGVKRMTLCAIRKIADDLLKLDVTRDIPMPPRPEPIPAATQETVETLAEKVEIDDYVCMLLIINCLGIRPGIAAQLTWDQFDQDFRFVRFSTAYGMKIVYIDLPYRQALAKYAQRLGDKTALLLQAFGANSTKALTVRALEYRLARIAEACDIKEHLTLTALQKARAILPALFERLISRAA